MVNQLLYSSHSSCYLRLPHAFIFICIHQSVHHHSSRAPPSSLPTALGSDALPGVWGETGVVAFGFMRHVMVCVIAVFWHASVAKGYTAWERLLYRYSVGACSRALKKTDGHFRHIAVLKGSVCECSGQVRERVWFLMFRETWCDLALLSLWISLALSNQSNGRFFSISFTVRETNSCTNTWQKYICGITLVGLRPFLLFF